MVILVISLLKNLLSSVVEKTKKLKEAGDGSLKRERERERGCYCQRIVKLGKVNPTRLVKPIPLF